MKKDYIILGAIILASTTVTYWYTSGTDSTELIIQAVPEQFGIENFEEFQLDNYLKNGSTSVAVDDIVIESPTKKLLVTFEMDRTREFRNPSNFVYVNGEKLKQDFSAQRILTSLISPDEKFVFLQGVTSSGGGQTVTNYIINVESKELFSIHLPQVIDEIKYTNFKDITTVIIASEFSTDGNLEAILIAYGRDEYGKYYRLSPFIRKTINPYNGELYE